MNKKSLFAIFTAITMLVAMPVTVLASSDSMTDSSGNLFSGGQSININTDVDNELFAAGYNLTVNGSNVDGSAFVAGYNVGMYDCNIDGSIFAAGETVTISSAVNHNIFAAGSVVALKDKSVARAVNVVGGDVSLTGSYQSVAAAGANVFFNGTVNGDITLEGENIEIGDKAVVTGTLTVTSSMEPVINSNNIGEYKFVKSAETDRQEVADKAVKGLIALKILGFFKKVIYWAVAYVILGILLLIFFKDKLVSSVDAFKTRTASVLASGIIAMLLLPIVCILLFVTGICAPVGGFVSVLTIVTYCIAGVFTAVTLVRELIFAVIAKKRINQFAEVAISAAVFGVIKCIPIIGKLLLLFAAMFTFGYIIQLAYDKIKLLNVKAGVEESK